MLEDDAVEDSMLIHPLAAAECKRDDIPDAFQTTDLREQGLQSNPPRYDSTTDKGDSSDQQFEDAFPLEPQTTEPLDRTAAERLVEKATETATYEPASNVAAVPRETRTAQPSAASWSTGLAHSINGMVELLSTEFASGWVEVVESGTFGHVLACLDGRVIGHAIAHISRPDLDRARSEGTLNAYAFIIIYDEATTPTDMHRVEIICPSARTPLARARSLKHDRPDPLRVFLYGSPRSGTSEMGTTLTSVLGIPWVGEGHIAPNLMQAFNALCGDKSSANGLVRSLAAQNTGASVFRIAKEIYFFGHGSSSFLDKTPGAPMIRASKFLGLCFPNSFSIFLWRNPVANVASRLVKFGGGFEGHCNDWAATMSAWLEERQNLPHFLEVRQEDMLHNPDRTAEIVAAYLGTPKLANGLARSLRSGKREQTGAGLGKTTLEQMDWTDAEKMHFRKTCGPLADKFGAVF